MEVEDFEAARPQASSQPSPAKPKEDKTPEKAKPGSGASSKPLGSSSGSSSSNINTFSSRFGSSASKQADDEDSDESDDEGQAFYAGGSRTSGQQVLGPSKKKEGADFVKHMFKRAREHGAEALDPNTPGGSGGAARQVFMGSGFRLGSNGKCNLLILHGYKIIDLVNLIIPYRTEIVPCGSKNALRLFKQARR